MYITYVYIYRYTFKRIYVGIYACKFMYVCMYTSV